MRQPLFRYIGKFSALSHIALDQGCARICLEYVLRTKFGAAKRASTLRKCNVAKHACTLCSVLIFGIAMLIVALAVITLGSLMIPATLLEDEMYITISYFISIPLFVIGLGIALFAVKKYNKTIF